ncbi:MAG: sugar-binding protein [Prolixibacteraceae bacterium]
MLKTLLLISAFAVCVGANAQKPEAIAKKASGMALTVDGVLDEAIWADATKYQIETPFNGEEIAGGAADCSGFFQTAWSDKGVYIAVTVTDDISQNDKNTAYGPDWANDMVEIYFDVNDVLADGVGSGGNKGHYGVTGIAIDGISAWGKNSIIAYKLDGASYVKEVFVSWSDIKNSDGVVFTPSETNQIGFDAYIIDNDRDTIAKGRNFRDRLVWSNKGDVTENYSNLDDAGILKFDLTTPAVVNPNVTVSKKLTGIPCAIDGVLTDPVWMSAARYPIQKTFNGENFEGGDADCSGFFQTAWNDKGLFIAVTVTDDITQNDKAAAYGPDWANDMVEIYFDMNEVKKDGVGSGGNKGHYGVTGIAIDGVAKWSANSKFAYKLTGTSYVKEAFISWNDLKNSDGSAITPSESVEIGFDMYIIDNDRDDAAKDRNFRDRLVWSNNGNITENYSNLDDAGILKFDMVGTLNNPAVASASKVTGDPIVANGILDETVWTDAVKYDIANNFIGESFTGNADCSGFFQTVWNEEGLYIAVTVTDDITQNDKAAAYGPDWANDMVEIYFDVNAEPKDGIGSGGNAGHFGVTGIAIDGAVTWGANSTFAYLLSGTNYVKEAFIAWSDLKDKDGTVFAAKATAKFGIDFCIVDNDRDSIAKDRNFRDRLMWSNIGTVAENYSNMDDAGTLTLASKAIANVYTVIPDGLKDQGLISNVLVYPNPAKGTLYVKNVSEKALISIFSLDGKMMVKSIGNEPINISTLQKGVYLVKVNDSSSTTIKRIVVQ